MLNVAIPADISKKECKKMDKYQAWKHMEMTGLSKSWSWKGFIYCGADRADMYKSSFGAGDLTSCGK